MAATLDLDTHGAVAFVAAPEVALQAAPLGDGVRSVMSDQIVSVVLQHRYGLTAPSARLALDLADGRSVDDVVAARKLRRTKLRTQMREVREKLGVERPAALMALIWRLRAGF